MNKQPSRIGLYLVLIIALVAGYFYLNNQVVSQSNYTQKQLEQALEDNKVVDATIQQNREVPTGSVIVDTTDSGQKIEEKKYTKWMDYDKIKGSPCVRTRKQGDYLVVNSAGGRKKLNRVFIDEKIPAGLRDQIPVVDTGSEILWIPGGRMNEQYKVTSTTGRVLELHYQGGVLT